MTGAEELLISKFGKMPLWVRVLTYLVMLFLFVYLTLAPRFINGKLVFRTPSGAEIPYRAGILRTHTDGRVLKFTVNEDGYWSIPLVSRVPTSVMIEVYLVDEKAWRVVELDLSDLLWRDLFTIDVTNPTALKVTRSNEPFSTSISSTFAGLYDLLVSPVYASDQPGMLKIKREVYRKIAKVLQKDPGQVTEGSPLFGEGAPTWVESAILINVVETSFDIRISDEVWKRIGTVGELVQLALVTACANSSEGKPRVWADCVISASNAQEIEKFFNEKGLDCDNEIRKLFLGRDGACQSGADVLRRLVLLMPYGGGFIFSYSGPTIFYSPDGKNLSGGGKIEIVYAGTQSASHMMPYKGGVLTAFGEPVGGIYYSLTGQFLGGGSHTRRVYCGGFSVTSMKGHDGGVETCFIDVCYFSPDGENLGGGGRTIRTR